MKPDNRHGLYVLSGDFTQRIKSLVPGRPFPGTIPKMISLFSIDSENYEDRFRKKKPYVTDITELKKNGLPDSVPRDFKFFYSYHFLPDSEALPVLRNMNEER